MKAAFSIVITFTFLFGAGVSGHAQQQKSATERSFEQAHEVLSAGIQAMGGLGPLQALTDVTREMSGPRTDEGQGMQPVLSRTGSAPETNRPKVKSVRDIRGLRTFDELEDVIFGGQPLKTRSVLAGNTAFSVAEFSRTIRVTPPGAIPNLRAARFRRYPETLLLSAWNRPETLRWVGDGEFEGRKQRVISFADVDGAQVGLYFDAQTNLLTKSEVLSDDPVLGDITIENVYGDWRPVDKVRLPFQYRDRVGGATQQDLHASSITLNTHPADSLFVMPDGYAKIDPAPPGPTVKKLGDDVYAILGSYNSVFVVFKDYVLVVEAGANNRYSSASIAEIKKIALDKPIRYLVSTHFHFDHVGGVRSYIAEGTTLVTTPTARSIIEIAAGVSHVMRPDALSRKPKPPAFEILTNGKRVFDDGSHTVELYRITSPHAGEMILAYLPREKILLEADLLDIPEAGVPVSGEDTLDLADKIQKLGLEVTTIVPVHGRIGTLSDLQQAVTNRPAAKPGTATHK